jgi:putative membrane protein
VALTDAQQTRVAEAVARVESHTAGEIVVRVVDQSDDYADVRLTLAGLSGLLLAEGLLLWFSLEASLGVALVAVTGLGVWLLLGWRRLLAFCVPIDRKAATVHRRAMVAFVEEGVHRTRDASGVLILVSMMEHRVEILADEGIHARVGMDGWSQHVQEVIRGIKAGALEAGLVEAIEGIGKDLAQHFPPRSDDVDELPNRPRVGDR